MIDLVKFNLVFSFFDLLVDSGNCKTKLKLFENIVNRLQLPTAFARHLSFWLGHKYASGLIKRWNMDSNMDTIKAQHKIRGMRSSRPKVFLGKGVLKICSKFTGEHLFPHTTYQQTSYTDGYFINSKSRKFLFVERKLKETF